MHRVAVSLAVSCVFLVVPDSISDAGSATIPRQDRRGIAFASFAPLNTDIFIASRDGSGARLLVSHPDLDYNPSFSPDGRWVIFTSTRNGSADLFRVRPNVRDSNV